MEYKLSINGETTAVEVETTGENSLSATIGESVRQVEYSRIDDNHIRMVIDGKSVNAYVAGASDEKMIVINGTTYRIGDADAAETRSRGKGRGGKSPNEVMTPMPAMVVKILIKEEDVVTKDQPLMTVSAMKMETTLRAPYGGRVTKINTSEGEKVMPGNILVDIEKEKEEEA